MSKTNWISTKSFYSCWTCPTQCTSIWTSKDTIKIISTLLEEGTTGTWSKVWWKKDFGLKKFLILNRPTLFGLNSKFKISFAGKCLGRGQKHKTKWGNFKNFLRMVEPMKKGNKKWNKRQSKDHHWLKNKPTPSQNFKSTQKVDPEQRIMSLMIPC